MALRKPAQRHTGRAARRCLAETQYELALWNVLLSIILGILYGIGDAAGDGAAPLIIGAGGHRERAESVLAGKRAPSAGSDASADDQRVVAWSASSYSRRIWSPPPLRHPLMIWSRVLRSSRP